MVTEERLSRVSSTLSRGGCQVNNNVKLCSNVLLPACNVHALVV
uniref:Uncharacterized protein n=1 Tax=Arundo donax TaxID=35708 RepID=A0A0A8XYV1_ARUDO